MTDETAPLDYAAALAEAQRLGYAEADPAGDVEGLDAVNKLVILARLAFDRWLDPAAVATRPDGADGPAGPGITTVSLADQADARQAGRIIRLLASASIDIDGSLSATVLPTALPRDVGARADGRCPQPGRDRRRPGRPHRLRRSGRRWRGDLVGGPRRSHRDRARGRIDLGTSSRRDDGRRGRRPRRRRGPPRDERHRVPDR